jgi:hypothetical protein
MDIIGAFEPVSEPNNRVDLSKDIPDDLSLDENGNVSLEEEYVIGKSADIFGDKIYDVSSEIENAVFEAQGTAVEGKKAIDNLKNAVKENVVKNIVDTVQENYGTEMKKSDKRKIESALNAETEKIADKAYTNYNIDKNVIENEREAALQMRHETGRTTEEINNEFDSRQKEATDNFRRELNDALDEFVNESSKTAVKTVETNIKEREKDVIEDGRRDHLRGFSRTIPSFLMAYGDNTVTLSTFDTVIPDKVFKEVTSITLDQFRFLRDGGEYIDEATGEKKYFEGNLFDPVVFDDSVREFLNMKRKLADYFDENSVEDIFDYIPPQKTNQIFTPKKTVKKMVDMLEDENRGCFDDPDKTFADLYMKSGLYIAEIVKRLYRSPKLKELYPEKNERLKHIFEKQVYGLAPTEIIYRIATNFILGFDTDIVIENHNFRQADALPHAKEGTLQKLLDELFSDR